MHPIRTRLSAPLAAVAAVAAIALVSGCSSSDGGGDSASAGLAEADVPAAEKPADHLDGPARDALADEAAGAESALQSTVDGTGDVAATRKEVDPSKDAARVEPGTSVIRTGMVSLEADDVEKTRFDVRKVVDKYRGTVTEQETTTGEGGEMSTARLVVRVPSASFEDATRDLEGVATLLSSNTAGEDVSTEVIDVDARIRAQRASVSRVEALLDQATNLQQVISIERQLANRQADLDSLVARQKYLADQTALSTITVTVEQPDEDEPRKKDDDDNGFVSGLEDGWDSFVDGLVVALTVLGFLLPWLILVAVLGVPAWLAVRRRAGRRPGAPPAPAAP